MANKRGMNVFQWTSVALVVASLALLAVNNWFSISGSVFNLRGQEGATVLVVFLTVGLIVQAGKIMMGHRHWLEFVITGLLLLGHMAADGGIWFTTQIMKIPLHADIPFWVVGLYWILGLVDILSPFMLREMGLFGQQDTPEKAIERHLKKIEELQTDVNILQREKALLEEKLNTEKTIYQERFDSVKATLEERYSSANALLEQRLSSAQAIVEQYRAIEEAEKTAMSAVHEAACPVCGVVFTKRTSAEARNAVTGHMNRKHVGASQANISVQSAGVVDDVSAFESFPADEEGLSAADMQGF